MQTLKALGAGRAPTIGSQHTEIIDIFRPLQTRRSQLYAKSSGQPIKRILMLIA
jgi:hypothetical protein